MKIRYFLEELRAPFFTASVIPVILGSAIAWNHLHQFNFLYFFAALLGGVLLHAGANVANDFFDYKNGSDNINTEYVRPFSGGSRLIQNGKLKPREVLFLSTFCYASAVIIGIWFFTQLGYTILILGTIGAISGFFYSAPPFKFVERGLGEILVGLNFGILMTLGAYFVQTGKISFTSGLVALPVAILIIAVLYINEFPDYNADKASQKKHLVVRLGRRRAAVGYLFLIATAYLAILANILSGTVPLPAFAVFLTVPIAINAVRTIFKHFEDPLGLTPAYKKTIQLHLFIGLILSASYIISGLK